MVKPWQLIRSEAQLDCRVFKVRKDMTVNPRTGKTHDMFVLENPNWVNVIPLTSDDKVVMVRQWRHGTRSVHLETPGGLMEDGESPEECGRRELLEETGYEAGEIVRLGTVHPNPALQNNLQHFVLATNCRRVGEPSLDHAEDISVELVPLAEVPAFIASGKLTHGIVICGFYWLNMHRQKCSQG